MRLGFCLSVILIAGAFIMSVASAEEGAPPGKKSVPAAKESTTATSSAHSGGRESLSTRDSASPAGGSHPGKGAPLNAGNSPATAPKESATGANPIDTRMSVETPRAPKKPPAGTEKLGAPAINPSRQTVPRDTLGAARNAIGLPLEDHARAKGAPFTPQGGAPATTTGRSATGIGIPAASGTPGALAAHPSSTPAITGSMPPQRTGITGTGMSRPGSGPGTLGGVARNAGAINGTTMRAKP